MQRSKLAFKLATLILVILPTLSMQTGVLLAEPSINGMVASTELINFYSMTTKEVTTFVQLLQTEGIPLFIVRLNGFSEWQSGSSSGIAKAKQVVETANSFGIEVAVDLHTWYTTWDGYFRDSASGSSANRAKYITYVRNVLNAFAGTNVYAFMVMNEPQARKASNSENQFILDVIAAAKEVTDKPISVRFMGGYSPTTGHYSAAIDQASDFVCRNTYWDARSPTRTVYGCTEKTLLEAISSSHAQGKRFWVTEFGKSKSNLEEQRSYVEAFVTWASSEGVDAVFCWVSQPDVSGETYNIFGGYTPYPAFYELRSDELPPDYEPPPEPLPETEKNGTLHVTSNVECDVSISPLDITMTTPFDFVAPIGDYTLTATSASDQTATWSCTVTEDHVSSHNFEFYVPQPESDILFEDNFESGNLNLWTGAVKSYGETITITNNEARQGTHSIRFAKTGSSRDRENAYIYKSISMQEAYANGYFQIDGSTWSQILPDAGDTVYFMRFTDGFQSLARVGIRRDAGIVKWLLYAGGTYVTGRTAVSADRWYNIELHWNAAEGTAEMFVDGARILQISAGNDYRISPKFVDVGIISSGRVQNQLTVYCDSFKLSATYIGSKSSAFPSWDVNQDAIVDISDLTAVSLEYGLTPESQRWNPREDLNSDGLVDLRDFMVVILHYGEKYT